MFGLGKIWRAFKYMIKGWVNRRSESLNENTAVYEATFDQSIEKEDDRYNNLVRIIGKQVTGINTMVAEVKTLTAEIEAAEKAKVGAKKMGESITAKLKAAGKTKEQIMSDPEFVKCMTAHGIVSKQIADKQSRITALEADIASEQKDKTINVSELTGIEGRKRQLEQEKNQGIVSIERAKDKEEQAKMRAGITKDTSNEDLAIARKARLNAESRAQVAAEASGASLDSQMAEFMNYAETNQSSNEFTSLMGLDDAPAAEHVESAKLPDA